MHRRAADCSTEQIQWLHPGYLSGVPDSGGRQLQTLVNCEFGATSCYVTFRIDYLLPNGVQKTLWSWKEAYDKRFYRANI